MKKLIISAATVTFLAAAPAMAAGPDFTAVDTDGDGSVTYEELAVVMPDVTKEQFNSVDSDEDGVLSKDEYEDAVE
ncbi:hypothetical protein [Sneathiella sp.]|jgi:Ca2+-binding EF-hand superfamily protein|uniref:hypothetical protein n=1 Tax=Sneathiella sp. TaxID=1964365 RepID=UPI002FE080E4